MSTIICVVGMQTGTSAPFDVDDIDMSDNVRQSGANISLHQDPLGSAIIINTYESAPVMSAKSWQQDADRRIH